MKGILKEINHIAPYQRISYLGPQTLAEGIDCVLLMCTVQVESI